MATANIVYGATAGYNGGWGSYGNSSAYAGNNSSNNYAAAIRFQTPAFSGTPSQLVINIPVIRGYTNSTATLYASLTTANPTASSAYTGNTPGTDSAQIYSQAITFSGLSASIQYVNIVITSSAIRPSTTYYLVLSADRPAASANNYIQVYEPSASTLTGYVTYTESASTISANVSTQELGKNVVFSIARANASYTHRLAYRYDSTGSFTEFAQNVGISYTYSFPLSMASSIPKATAGVWQIRCQTYNGTSLIGEAYMTLTLKVPDSVLPVISAFSRSMVSSNSTVSSWGIFVQGYSALALTLQASASYSTIQSWSIVYADGSYGEENAGQSININQNTDILATTGDLQITATVTDARGRSVTRTLSYTVEPYTMPSLSTLSVYRSTSNGTKSDSGTYISVTAVRMFSSCGGKNSVQAFTVAYKERSTSAYSTETALTSGTRRIIGAGSISNIKSYNVRITLRDQLNTVTFDAIIPTQSATMNAKPGGNAVAFGKYAETENSLELGPGWKLILNNAQGASADLDYTKLANLLNYINTNWVDKFYPVGSIYMSANSTNPATLFGGTWTQLQNRFLVGVGSSYTAGATGGAATHTHGNNSAAQNGSLIAQIGVSGTSNLATLQSTANSYESTSWGRLASTWDSSQKVSLTSGAAVAGVTASASNIPPYLAVYMWQRTA